jgi:hypothetical protein
MSIRSSWRSTFGPENPNADINIIFGILAAGVVLIFCVMFPLLMWLATPYE